MILRVLALGDVVGKEGISTFTNNRFLQKLRDEKNIHLVIANCENASPGNGLKPAFSALAFI